MAVPTLQPHSDHRSEKLQTKPGQLSKVGQFKQEKKKTASKSFQFISRVGTYSHLLYLHLVIRLSQYWCIALFMQSVSLKANWRNVRRSNVIKRFCAGEAWEECRRNVWIFWSGSGKIMKDSSKGGWEPHRDVASHCFQGPCGGRCCQCGWRSAIEPH